MYTLPNIIRYYKECYQADNREISLTNFFSNKVEHRLIIEGEENLITGLLPYIPVDSEKARAIQKTLHLYSKEKEFYYASFFIAGQYLNASDKAEKVSGPLFLYPASIIEIDTYHYIEIDINRRLINFHLLRTINSNAENNTDHFYGNLLEELPLANIDFVQAGQLARVLKKYFTDIDTEPLIDFPALYTEKVLKQLLQTEDKEGQTSLMAVPASGLCVIKKSADTLGVLNELSAMAERKEFSAPLLSLFLNQANKQSKPFSPGYVPAVLSKAQEKIIKAASSFTQTVVIGPPGTGKSYTSAALAIEHISKGKSVLIASKTNHAVDVIGDKIENQLGIKDIVVRGGRKDYMRFLKDYLQNLLSGIRQEENGHSLSLKQLESKLGALNRKITRLERSFIKLSFQEQHRGKYFARYYHSKSFFHKSKKRYIQWRIENQLPHWQVIAELETALQEKNWLTAVYIQQKFHEQITQTLQHNREEIKLLLQALRARTGSKQERIFNEINFKTILKTLPIWLVNLSDIYEVLPLEKELFDIIIIDESSQCDIASCLPVLYRAKRVLFSGDPKQLRHISFLSQLKQHLLQKKYNLPEHSELFDYREKSILDIVSTHVKSQNQVIFLDEHYRSHPSIIGFSNQHFYNNTLRIMTRKTHKSDNQHIELIPCDGKRTKHGYNMEEAEQIVQRISKIIETERELDNSSCRSIGILSPFRDQADYISSLLFKYLTLADIKKHQIAVGTAYNFQGEERDIMLLSLALDAKSHPSAFYHVNKPDVFNVSITRAKSFQQIFLSIEPAQLKQDSLLRNYLENIQTNRYGPQITNQQSIEHEVKLVLESLNLEVWQDFPVAGQVIDLVVHYHHHIYGIDLIGFPGRWAESYSLDTYKMAARAGLKIFPLPYTYWLMNQSTCVQALRQFMNIENSKK